MILVHTCTSYQVFSVSLQHRIWELYQLGNLVTIRSVLKLTEHIIVSNQAFWKQINYGCISI